MSENEKNAVLSIPTPPTSASSSNSSVCSTNIASGSVCLASCNELGTAINVTLVDSHSIEGSNHESDTNSDAIEVCLRFSRDTVTFWRILSVYFVVILMFGFVYVYTVPENVAIEENFNVTVLENQMDQILLRVSYLKLENVLLLQSSYSSDTIKTIFDFSKNLVAHKDIKNKKCYIRSALASPFSIEYQQIKEFVKNRLVKWSRPSEVIPMAVLKRKVPDEILHSIVGSHISQFCGIFKARWLIIYESENDQTEFQKAINVSTTISTKPKTMIIDNSFYKILLYLKM